MGETMQHHYDGEHPLGSLAQGWLAKIERAKEVKQPWQDIADECMHFFAGSCGFLWDDKYRHKFWQAEDGAVQPKFKVTINKAFELVALFGPTLYWRNPNRQANPRKPLELPPELFGDIQNDPMAAQQYQGMTQSLSLDAAERKMRAQLMERYLNWTPYELGLHRQAELAITEALIKGRGLLFPRPYQPPGTDRIMVGSWWVSVDDLVIDPDAESMDEAWWIAVRVTEPVWRIERDRGYKPGTLQPSAQFESANAQGEIRGNDLEQNERAAGRTQDLMTYWKIWSRCGPGTRLTDVKLDIKDWLDQAAGDHCYLEVAQNTPFFLNLASPVVTRRNTEEVRRALRWPTPHYRDGKWPCAVLDFYPHPRKPWPVAPLAPALGELKVINVFLAHLCNRVWMSCRDFIVCLESARASLEKEIKQGKDLSFIFLEEIHDSIDKVVGFLQHPPTNLDAFKVLEWFFELFDKRTGLSELVYGMQRVQSRSATDSQIKQQQVSIRPDHMAAKVEEWQTDLAQREALEVKWRVTGQDVRDLLGDTGAQLWDHYISAADVERVIRDIDYRLEANSARKPNRQQDIATRAEFMPIALPVAQGYAAATGNFGPVEWLLQHWAEKVELDASGLQFPPPPPPPEPPPEADPAQQAAQAEQVKLEAEQARLGMEQQKHEQSLVHRQQEHEQDMILRGEERDLKMRQSLLERAANRAAQNLAGAGAR